MRRFIFTASMLAAMIGGAHADPLQDIFGSIFKPPVQQVEVNPVYKGKAKNRHMVLNHNYPGDGGTVLQRLGSGTVVKATWYKCCKRTANGERFNPGGLTAAHKTLPFGTRVRVESVNTGRSVIVRINDRGPHRRGYTYDLAQGAARAIGHSGTGSIRATVIR